MPMHSCSPEVPDRRARLYPAGTASRRVMMTTIPPTHAVFQSHFAYAVSWNSMRRGAGGGGWWKGGGVGGGFGGWGCGVEGEKNKKKKGKGGKAHEGGDHAEVD